MPPRQSSETLKRTILARQCSAAHASPTTTIATITIPAITAITISTLLFILLWYRFETKRCARKSIWPARQVLESAGNNKDVCDDVFCNTASNIGTLRAPASHRYGSIPRNVETQTSNSNVSYSVAPLEAVPWASTNQPAMELQWLRYRRARRRTQRGYTLLCCSHKTSALTISCSGYP